MKRSETYKMSRNTKYEVAQFIIAKHLNDEQPQKNSKKQQTNIVQKILSSGVKVRTIINGKHENKRQICQKINVSKQLKDHHIIQSTFDLKKQFSEQIYKHQQTEEPFILCNNKSKQFADNLSKRRSQTSAQHSLQNKLHQKQSLKQNIEKDQQEKSQDQQQIYYSNLLTKQNKFQKQMKASQSKLFKPEKKLSITSFNKKFQLFNNPYEKNRSSKNRESIQQQLMNFKLEGNHCSINKSHNDKNVYKNGKESSKQISNDENTYSKSKIISSEPEQYEKNKTEEAKYRKSQSILQIMGKFEMEKEQNSQNNRYSKDNIKKSRCYSAVITSQIVQNISKNVKDNLKQSKKQFKSSKISNTKHPLNKLIRQTIKCNVINLSQANKTDYMNQMTNLIGSNKQAAYHQFRMTKTKIQNRDEAYDEQLNQNTQESHGKVKAMVQKQTPIIKVFDDFHEKELQQAQKQINNLTKSIKELSIRKILEIQKQQKRKELIKSYTFKLKHKAISTKKIEKDDYFVDGWQIAEQL